MRLIDADSLNSDDLCDVCGSADCSNCFTTKAFEEWIQMQPTAYDIEKVVRQLWKTSDCYRKSIGFCDDTNCFECGHCHLTLKQAIEIVKKGGTV